MIFKKSEFFYFLFTGCPMEDAKSWTLAPSGIFCLPDGTKFEKVGCMLQKILLAAGLLTYPLLSSYAQVGDQFLTKINNWNAFVHLPDDYDANPTKRYPVIIFVPGLGEIGTDASKVLIYGPGYYIARGHKMQFTVNGVLEKPIVISLQPPTSWPYPGPVDTRVAEILTRWRVDTTRVYGTGLSMGGWTWEQYVTTASKHANRLAAMVAMSAPGPESISNMKYWALCGGKWWGFEGTNDYRFMDRIRDTMNTYNPGTAKYTKYSGGHCCWNTWYNPDWRENGENIYEWMLKQKKEKYTFIFNGSGGYSTLANWWSQNRPPATIAPNMQISILCPVGGFCDLTEPVTLQTGSSMTISKSSSMKVTSVN
jgi:hypothetical protein